MKILNGINQGSDAWRTARAKFRTASEASAMMGVGYKTRADLVREKATGAEVEVSDYQREVLFARGHEIEAKARPIAEEIIGDELFPVTATDDAGYLLASFDGLTMDESIIWECKTIGEKKAEAVRAGEVPEIDYWQVVQQLVISRADKCLYMLSNGEPDGTLYTWVTLKPEDEAALLAGWKQFDRDVENYQHVEPTAEPVGTAPEQLPALHIEVTGEVRASNLTAFRDHALAVFRGINTDLQTDSDFADAEKTTRWCKEVEAKLDAAKDHALAQTSSIDELFRAIDQIKEEARAKRLELERLVKARKDAIRAEIVADAKGALAHHIEQLNTSLAVPVPRPDADFAAAIKGKRTVSSLRDAADTLLAQAKIAANESAELIRANLKIIEDAGHTHLFADRAQLVLRDSEWVAGMVKLRIREHEDAEQKRLEEERARIRAEEERKARAAAEREAAERAAQERQARDDAERQRLAEEQRELEALRNREQALSAAEARRTEEPVQEAAASPQPEHRPRDMDILHTLAVHYRVHEMVALGWLLDMDLQAAERELAKEFAT